MSDAAVEAQKQEKKMKAFAAAFKLVQQIVKFLTWSHVVVGAVFLFALLWCHSNEGKLALMAAAPFYFAFGFAADLVKKDLSLLKPVMRIMAIGQLGFAVVLIIGSFALPLPSLYWAWAAVALILGALPALVYSRAKKML